MPRHFANPTLPCHKTFRIHDPGLTTTGDTFRQVFNLFYSARPIGDATCSELAITYKRLTNFDVTILVTMLQVPDPLSGKGKKNSLEWSGLLAEDVRAGSV